MAYNQPYDDEPRASRRAPRGGGRLMAAFLVALMAFMSYQAMRSENPVTGESQHVALSASQEVALGLQAAPEMAAQHGGLVPDSDPDAVIVDAIGAELVRGYPDLKKTPYRFEFHLLKDPETVNAFALPGGQIFITRGLYKRLRTPGMIAGVLGHEIGHVVERHGAQQMAQAQLTQGLTAAAAMATYDPNNPSTAAGAAVAQMVGKLVNLKYGRQDELESDEWGVILTASAGYDPRAVIEVMKVLQAAAGGKAPPEFMSTHPDPGNRIERLQGLIKETFPNGLPAGMKS